MSDGAVFLTGATGALGSWIARQALADGVRVRALSRATPGLSAAQRVEQSLSIVTDQRPLTSWQAVEGDIHDKHLDAGDASFVIHCAACTAFHERSAVDSHQTNVEGLQNVLELCTRQRLPLVHISTAYVCGDRTATVLEKELVHGQLFNNVYERTKCAGERLVSDWSARTGIAATILRPSIVLGDWQLGRAVRFNTLYHLMAALDSVGPSLQKQELRLIGDSRVTKNILPVDYFASVAWQIIRRGQSGTYHITHPNPITMGELGTIFNQLFNITIRFVRPNDFDASKATPLERMCSRIMAPYRRYMLNPEPSFDRTATLAATDKSFATPPTLDAAYFQRLLDYGRQANWGRGHLIATDGDSSAEQVREYFKSFLVDRMHENLLPDLNHLTAQFSIAMTDHPQLTWSLDVQNGVLCSIDQGSTIAACSFKLTTNTFLEIATVRVSPKQAFFKGRIKITGNIELGLKVATVLSKFFSAYPFHVATA
ncbi:SDR family oxidoreductase [soil metagenome]